MIELKHFEDAVECCNDVIEEYSDYTGDDFDAAVWYGYKFGALIKLKRFEEALECYDKISELDPSEDYVWRDQKNKLLKKLGREEETEMSNDES